MATLADDKGVTRSSSEKEHVHLRVHVLNHDLEPVEATCLRHLNLGHEAIHLPQRVCAGRFEFERMGGTVVFMQDAR